LVGRRSFRCSHACGGQFLLFGRLIYACRRPCAGCRPYRRTAPLPRKEERSDGNDFVFRTGPLLS
jgi:hypothetical protein